MTIPGYESLKAELKQLTSKDRPAVINAISTAREHGDLKENAEYHAAKEQQGFIEGRIQELNAKLALANVIDITKLSGEKIVFGASVSFVNVDTDEESNYQLVGVDEADLKINKILFPHLLHVPWSESLSAILSLFLFQKEKLRSKF